MEPYLIEIHKAKSNYSAHSPDVDGCAATGDTIEETIENMKGALQFHFKGMRKDGDPIPKPKGIKAHISEIEVGGVYALVKLD